MINKLKKIFYIIGDKYEKKFKFLIFLNIFNFFLEFASIISIPIFVAIIVDSEIFISKLSFLNNFEKKDIIVFAGIFVSVSFILKNLFLIMLIRLQANFCKEIKILISEKLFNHYLFDTYLDNISVNPSIKARNVTSEIQGFYAYITNLNKLFLEGTAIILIFFIIFFTAPIISISIFIFFLIISLIYLKSIKPKIKDKSLKNQKILAKFTQMIYETFGALKDVKILNKEKEIFNLYKENVKNYEKNLLFFDIYNRLPKIILELASIILLVSLSMIFLKGTSNINDLLPILALLVVSIVRLLPAFSGMNTSLFYMKAYRPHLEKVFSEIKNIKNKNYEKNHVVNEKIFKPNLDIKKNYLVLDNINFNYENKKSILENISFNISEGSTFGIIGPTGSGKSTLLQLMMGLIKSKKGNIFFKNNNIFSIYSEWIRSISYVSQNIFVLDGTVQKNIAFNFDNSKIDQYKLEKAVEIAELREKILSLPNKFEEKVGVDGLKFSGGERQRLAIARAVYKDAPVLFLDEFTSSLDTLTEEKILTNFKKYFSNKTIVLITHRQNTIENCDKLCELKNLNLNDAS